MRHRPKPPSLVSMWMLDVFCCALGCVTLLWLLNTREAGEQARKAGSALEILQQTESELKARQTELIATKAELEQTKRKLNAELEELRGKWLAMTDERDRAMQQLALTKGDLSTAQSQLVAASSRAQEQDDLLSKKQKELKEVINRISALTQSSDEVAKLLREKQRERDELALKAKRAEDQLNDLDARLKSVMKESDDAKGSLAAMRKSGDELAAAKAIIADMQRQSKSDNAMIVDLQGQKAKLADKFDKLQRDNDSRFAGITMTGKRVVFMIDTSGSMKLIDEKNSAPEKWPTVVETISKVMRSLPDLEQFQVVTFSRQAEYLFKSPEWIKYQGEASVRQIAEKLKTLQPDGDTNMYDALDLAFKLRSGGLDTIYLFSDGLPTSGPGLTAEQEKTMQAAERSDRLSRHIRSTLNTVWNRGNPGQRVRINSVGFFFESPEVGAFLWALSRENDGSFVGMSRP
jgi:uncharacterized phage infection (PIP) family protein YhgE